VAHVLLIRTRINLLWVVVKKKYVPIIGRFCDISFVTV
jgi:hypothetical protein